MANLLARWGRTQLFPAYVEMYDDGSVVVSPDGPATYTLTSSVLSAVVKLSGFVYDLTGATTGAAYVSLTAALAESWVVKVGSTALQTYVTTTNKIRVRTNVLAAFAATVSVSTAANHALVFGTAGSNQTALTGNYLVVVNGSGSSKDLTLPAVADLAGVPLHLYVTGGSEVVVKTSGGAPICTIADGKGAIVFNDGTNFGSIAGA